MASRERAAHDAEAHPRVDSGASLAADVVRALLDRGQTLATAESLTGGLVGAEICAVPGASAVYSGGVISYDNSVKAAVLGVDWGLLEARGSVDPEVAVEMAAGARRVCATDWGVSTTGVAGPEPHDGKSVGTVFIGLSGPGVTEAFALQAAGDREGIRQESVRAALTAVRARLDAAS